MKKVVTMFLMALITTTISLNAQEDMKMVLINQAKKDTGEITPTELKRLFDDEKAVTILDVREAEQRAEGDIYDDMFSFTTVQITRGNLEFEASTKLQDKTAFIVTFCRNGGRGALATQTLHKMGYKNVKNLQGGIADWIKGGGMVKTGLGVIELKVNK